MNELDLFAVAIAITDSRERSALLERECAERPDDRQRLDQLLKAHFESNSLLGASEEAPTAALTDNPAPTAPHRISVEAEGTVLSLKVAALRAWFGQEKELAATRQRILANAEGTDDVLMADRAARACSILPSTDKKELEAAIVLARRAVDLGKDHPLLYSFLMALGMAEYRGGHFAEAEVALTKAMDRGKSIANLAGTSAFYRAMSLFRQGKTDEARKLAIEAAAKMKPLPKDEQNPMANVVDPDDLILWLAYKEAKALIGFDAPAAVSTPLEKK